MFLNVLLRRLSFVIQGLPLDTQRLACTFVRCLVALCGTGGCVTVFFQQNCSPPECRRQCCVFFPISLSALRQSLVHSGIKSHECLRMGCAYMFCWPTIFVCFNWKWMGSLKSLPTSSKIHTSREEACGEMSGGAGRAPGLGLGQLYESARFAAMPGQCTYCPSTFLCMWYIDSNMDLRVCNTSFQFDRALCWWERVCANKWSRPNIACGSVNSYSLLGRRFGQIIQMKRHPAFGWAMAGLERYPHPIITWKMFHTRDRSLPCSL